MVHSVNYNRCRRYLEEGSAVDVGHFLAWFEEHKEGTVDDEDNNLKWVKMENGHDWGFRATLLHYSLEQRCPEAVVMAVLGAFPGAIYIGGDFDEVPIPLFWAFGKTPEALTIAIINATYPWHTLDTDNSTPLQTAVACNSSQRIVELLLNLDPDAVKQSNKGRRTVLHTALVKKASVEITMLMINAMIERFPEGLQYSDEHEDSLTSTEGETTALEYALEFNSSDAVLHLLRNNLPARTVCKTYLMRGKDLDVTAFSAWFEVHKDDGDKWITELEETLFYGSSKDIDIVGESLLWAALSYHAPESTTLAVLNAWPGAVEIKAGPGWLVLHRALQCNASNIVVRAIINLWPAAVKETTLYKKQYGERGEIFDETPLHILTKAYGVGRRLDERNQNLFFGGVDNAWDCNPAEKWDEAKCRNSNMHCFTLVRNGASLTARDSDGRTPVQSARGHIAATLREITLFNQKKHKHLGLEHFRDWTTVSHKWCPPSAQLTALTVLLVGETYTRGLLPRLPMDVWYRILNFIPRYELRQGGCSRKEESAASVEYRAIVIHPAHRASGVGCWGALIPVSLIDLYLFSSCTNRCACMCPFHYVKRAQYNISNRGVLADHPFFKNIYLLWVHAHFRSMANAL